MRDGEYYQNLPPEILKKFFQNFGAKIEFLEQKKQRNLTYFPRIDQFSDLAPKALNKFLVVDFNNINIIKHPNFMKS